MPSLPDVTVKRYNNIPLQADIDRARYLLTQIEALTATLLGSDDQSGLLERMHQRYEHGVPQDLCDDIGQVAEDIFDRLRRVDPVQRAEYDAWEESQAVHDMVAFHASGYFVAESIQGGHCA